MKKEKYRVTCSTFLRGSEEDGYTYELTFNRSLEHTGRFQGISNGLNRYERWENSRLRQIGIAFVDLFNAIFR